MGEGLVFHDRKTPSLGEEACGDVLAAARRVAGAAWSDAAANDRDGAFPAVEIGHLHRERLLHAPLPPAMGGVGLNGAALRDVLVAVGRGSLALGRLYEGHVNAVLLVARYGAPAALDLLRREADAGRISGVWMAGPPLRLEECNGGTPGVLRGHKLLCSGSGHVHRPLVAADTAEGSQLVLPTIADPARTDASAWLAQGMKATATGTVDFDGVTVGADEIVGSPGDYLRPPYFRGGAWRVTAVQLGGLAAVFEEYRASLAAGPHWEHPLQLARFGEATIAFDTARLWVDHACAVAEGPFIDADAVDATVDLARNAFTEAALRVVAAAQKAIGLRAFLAPNALERAIRDLTTYMRQPMLDVSLMSAAAYRLRAEA